MEDIKKTPEEIIDFAIDKFNKKIDEATKGFITQKEYTELKNEIKSLEISQLVNESKELKSKVEELHFKHGELIDLMAKQSASIMKITESSIPNEAKKEFAKLTKKEQLSFLTQAIIKSEEFKQWAKRDFRGNFEKTTINDLITKAVTGLVADHTGTIWVTERDPFIKDISRKQTHMRDYITVRPTDQEKITYGTITFQDIYDLGMQMLTENEAISDVNFETGEETSNVVRLGILMPISKRYFRGAPEEFINHIMDNLPDGIMFKEDTQILNGNGTSPNLNGILKEARTLDLTPQSYAAGAIASVAQWITGKQTLVTFTAAHGLLDGDKLTILHATHSGYNTTHTDILVQNEKQILINVAYVAEADTSAWTGEGSSYWYQSVTSAQEFDTLSAAQSILDAGLYNASKIFLNPQTIAKIGTLKGTDNHYIGVSRDSMGNLNLNGMEIVSHNRIPAGWFLIGDFNPRSIELREYSPISIQFIEDVTTNRGNYIVALADEEIHLLKKNPQYYIFDRFETAKAQLEIPLS